MKRIKAVNGYTIFEATQRDEQRYDVKAGVFYVYFSSDIRDYGLSNSYPEWEDDNAEAAIEWALSGNYAIAKEIAEASSTAPTFEEIEEIERLLDAGVSPEEIEEIENESVCVFERGGFWFIRIEAERCGVIVSDEHGIYFTREAAEAGALNYSRNTGAIFNK